VGWLKVEAQGCREGDNGPTHTTYLHAGVMPIPPSSQGVGKGDLRVMLGIGPRRGDRPSGPGKAARGGVIRLRARTQRALAGACAYILRILYRLAGSALLAAAIFQHGLEPQAGKLPL
jgi:hypothetical protein